MSNVKTSAKGWPLLEPASLIADIPDYTKMLADKLDKGDADVAAAVNAATQAKDAAATAKSASDDLKGKIGALETLSSDTGWVKVNLQPKNGWQTYGDGLKYRKVGKMCQIELPIYRSGGVPTTMSTVYDNLPEEIASISPMTALGNASDATMLCLLNGRTIQVARLAGNAQSWFGTYFCYLVA